MPCLVAKNLHLDPNQSRSFCAPDLVSSNKMIKNYNDNLSNAPPCCWVSIQGEHQEEDPEGNKITTMMITPPSSQLTTTRLCKSSSYGCDVPNRDYSVSTRNDPRGAVPLATQLRRLKRKRFLEAVGIAVVPHQQQPTGKVSESTVVQEKPGAEKDEDIGLCLDKRSGTTLDMMTASSGTLPSSSFAKTSIHMTLVQILFLCLFLIGTGGELVHHQQKQEQEEELVSFCT